MSGIINIEEHNKVVETLDAKKAAIREAAELGEKALESNKPKMPSFICGKIKMYPKIQSNKSVDGYKMSINDHNVRVEYPNSFGYYNYYDDGKELKCIAACIIKAFGPIPQELIDSVEVK